jgi:hypothetical protein
MGLTVLGKINRGGVSSPINTDRISASRIVVLSKQEEEIQKAQNSKEWRAEKPGKKSAFLQDMLSDNE